MKARRHHLPALVLAAAVAGCGGDSQPAFPELHPVQGIVHKAGQPVSGGAVQFIPDPDRPEFLVNSEVGPDGTFRLSTVRTTDRSGERKPGAEVGTYKVVYTPPHTTRAPGGQSAMSLPGPVTVNPGVNDIPLDLSRK